MLRFFRRYFGHSEARNEVPVEQGKLHETTRPRGFLEHILFWRKIPEPPPEPLPKTLFRRAFKIVRWEVNFASRECFASSTASIFSVLFSHPLDVIKYNVQMMPKTKKSAGGRILFIEQMRILYKKGGIRALYKGHAHAQKDMLLQTIAMFYTYQRVYHLLEEYSMFKQYPPVCTFTAGFLSASIAVLTLQPLTALKNGIKNRLVILERYGPIQAAYDLRKPKQWRNLYRGSHAAFMQVGTVNGLKFLLFELIRDQILLTKQKKQVSTGSFIGGLDTKGENSVDNLTNTESLFAGAMSGVLGDVLMHPMDVVNTRLGMKALTRQRYRYDDTCRRYGQCFKLIYRKNGLGGLYAGWVPNLVRATIGTAVQFAVYERMQEWLKPYFQL